MKPTLNTIRSELLSLVAVLGDMDKDQSPLKLSFFPPTDTLSYAESIVTQIRLCNPGKGVDCVDDVQRCIRALIDTVDGVGEFTTEEYEESLEAAEELVEIIRKVQIWKVEPMKTYKLNPEYLPQNLENMNKIDALVEGSVDVADAMQLGEEGTALEIREELKDLHAKDAAKDLAITDQIVREMIDKDILIVAN